MSTRSQNPPPLRPPPLRPPTVHALVAALLAIAGCAHTETPAPGFEVAHAHPTQPDAEPASSALGLANAAVTAMQVTRDRPDHPGQAGQAANTREAIDLANAALRKHPFLLEAGLVKVEAHLALGERIEAHTFAERLRDAHPARVEAHYAFAKTLFAIGRALPARAAFEKALTLAPDDLPSRLGLLACVALITSHDLTVLVPMAEQLLSDHPAHAAEIHHQLAIGHEQRGDPTSARRHYELSLAAGDTPLAHYNLARLLHETAGLPAARPHYQRFIDSASLSHRREIDAIRNLLAQEPP